MAHAVVITVEVCPDESLGEDVLVTAEERSIFEGNAPSYEAIRGAMLAARLGDDVRRDGMWIGPGPRVVRTSTVGERFGTLAAWVYGVGDGATIDRARLQARVEAELGRVGSWPRVNVVEYSPAVNGALPWWLSGEATVTRTRDAFPTGAGRVDAPDNPTGPTTPATHPTSPGELGRSLTSELGDFGTGLLVLGVLGAVGYALATRGR